MVDDEVRFVDSLQEILRHYDYDCTRALDGQQAIGLLKQTCFDVAMVDVGLPDMSGVDIVSFINRIRRQTTAVMLTGMNTVETAVQAMKEGAYDFLSKPVNHDLLIKTIDKAVEHNRLQRELKASNMRFQTLAEVAWEGIAIHEDGRLVEVNEQFFRMFGYKKEEFDMDGFLERIMDSADFESVRRSQLVNNGPAGFEFTGVRKDGTTFPLEAKSHTMDYYGRPAHVLIMRDISERIKNERIKLELQRKLATASKLNSLGMMAGSVAHDLNNILTAIVSYPEFLLNQMHESDPYYRAIKKIQEAGVRAASVVDDLVSIARGGVEESSIADLNDIILNHFDSIEHSERLAKFSNILIETDLQPDLNHIACSPQHINKILLNLIGNALEAVQNNGTVRVATEDFQLRKPVSSKHVTFRPGKYVKLTVADNGPGIGEMNLDYIFDPFFTTKKRGKSGTGLGLTIVWNIVQEHKGWIEAKDNNPGAVFEVYLPAAIQAVDETAGPAGKISCAGREETILLVDNQPEQNAVMGQMLGLLGYKTHSVTSGEEGIEYLRKRSVDLVLLDMIMEDGLNGCETYEEMIKIQPGLKAIVVSGYFQSEERRRARELGISIFLDKPVMLPKLSQAVKQIFEETTQH